MVSASVSYRVYIRVHFNNAVIGEYISDAVVDISAEKTRQKHVNKLLKCLMKQA